jgi:hypothetical protein
MTVRLSPSSLRISWLSVISLAYIEAMTDQVEVFIKGRKVAIYMA